ncbi:hypothetical protein PAAG_02670 [Paracoccidioides lutzii Pb01]|uniref:Uncharacterized protein n=1 Tax=Paracoccidioides lutzii (strain ATCC MYA-826 / Pb01) TaxID=502779 RepID=C1GVX5_PARBA|nr:hypothetical protein PAAG_02670 [Paracoccidioides lutzii Pb01]EEH40694.2 hypothetical protein PAAG_02670 [Paracoccidioides lutzii Pb01]
MNLLEERENKNRNSYSEGVSTFYWCALCWRSMHTLEYSRQGPKRCSVMSIWDVPLAMDPVLSYNRDQVCQADDPEMVNLIGSHGLLSHDLVVTYGTGWDEILYPRKISACVFRGVNINQDFMRQVEEAVSQEPDQPVGSSIHILQGPPKKFELGYEGYKVDFENTTLPS